MNLIHFLTKNKQKRITLMAYWYSAVFRAKIKWCKPKKLHRQWGEQGKESADSEKPWKYRYARNVAIVVDRICNKTPWESKCLVRALTAQKILKKKRIASTLYLGCAHEGGKAVAHAWLRVGKMYVTGGNGETYITVDRYAVLFPEEEVQENGTKE